MEEGEALVSLGRDGMLSISIVACDFKGCTMLSADKWPFAGV